MRTYSADVIVKLSEMKCEASSYEEAEKIFEHGIEDWMDWLPCDPETAGYDLIVGDWGDEDTGKSSIAGSSNVRSKPKLKSKPQSKPKFPSKSKAAQPRKPNGQFTKKPKGGKR